LNRRQIDTRRFIDAKGDVYEWLVAEVLEMKRQQERENELIVQLRANERATAEKCRYADVTDAAAMVERTRNYEELKKNFDCLNGKRVDLYAPNTFNRRVYSEKQEAVT